jgi:dephospho-CoA kinase
MRSSGQTGRRIVGLVGHGGSGKDTVARMLEARGFTHVSASELVREEIYRRGGTPTRALQTAVANEMRAERGGAYFVRLAVGREPSRTSPLVISGVYAVAEATAILDYPGGALLAVTADPTGEVSYQRVQSRSEGSRDHLTLEEFREAQKRENSGAEAGQANVASCLALATHTILNTGSLEALQQQVEALVRQLGRRE